MKKILFFIFVLLLTGCGGVSEETDGNQNPLVWDQGNWDKDIWQ